jgi:hypothetical protein
VLAGPQQLSPVRGNLVRAAGPVTYRVFVANRSTQRIARHVDFSLGGRGQSRFVALGPHSVGAVRFVDRAPKLGTPLILRVWFDDGDNQLVLHVRYRRA